MADDRQGFVGVAADSDDACEGSELLGGPALEVLSGRPGGGFFVDGLNEGLGVDLGRHVVGGGGAEGRCDYCDDKKCPHFAKKKENCYELEKSSKSSMDGI